MSAVDVVLLTKNSGSHLKNEIFQKCLRSIRRQIPINTLVVVDAFSSDNTLKTIRSHFTKVKVIRSSALRGKAREIGIRNVETEWFAFVDSDIVLCENWFNELMRYARSQVGGIEGRVNRIDERRPPRVKRYARAKTHCTLIRTQAVENINIPSDLDQMEDQFIRKYVEKQGYKWVKPLHPISTHYQTKIWDWKTAYEIGRASGKYNLTPFWLDVVALTLLPFKKAYERKSLLWKLIGRLEAIVE